MRKYLFCCSSYISCSVNYFCFRDLVFVIINQPCHQTFVCVNNNVEIKKHGGRNGLLHFFFFFNFSIINSMTYCRNFVLYFCCQARLVLVKMFQYIELATTFIYCWRKLIKNMSKHKFSKQTLSDMNPKWLYVFLDVEKRLKDLGRVLALVRLLIRMFISRNLCHTNLAYHQKSLKDFAPV